MPAEVALTKVRWEDMSVVIKDVHIGTGGEARTVEISYDEVKRQLCLKIYELGGTEVLRKFYLTNGRILEEDSEGGVFPMRNVPTF